MKPFLLCTLFCGLCLPLIKAAESLAPSGLTIVVCDADSKVLDTVVVPDDHQSRSVKFYLPQGADEIRVFALGKRLHRDIPKNWCIKGHPDDKKWMGLGYVEAHVENGVLVAIDGNGFIGFEMDGLLAKRIKEDIDDGKPAAITKIE